MTNEEKITELIMKYFPYINPYAGSRMRRMMEELVVWKQDQIVESLSKKKDATDDTSVASYLEKTIEDLRND